jgi:hypothetical protein
VSPLTRSHVTKRGDSRWKGRTREHHFFLPHLTSGQSMICIGQVHFIIIIISIISSVCLSVLHSRAKLHHCPSNPYDPPKPHQSFPGVLMLSQASVVIGTCIRSCPEASLPAAGSREHCVRRARPLSLRCCVHRSLPCHPFPTHHMPRHPSSHFCAVPAPQSLLLKTRKRNKTR